MSVADVHYGDPVTRAPRTVDHQHRGREARFSQILIIRNPAAALRAESVSSEGVKIRVAIDSSSRANQYRSLPSDPSAADLRGTFSQPCTPETKRKRKRLDMRVPRLAASALAFVGIAWVAVPNVSGASDEHSAVPPYQHIVEIEMENQSYSTIISNSASTQLNALANTYVTATNYFVVTHPSERAKPRRLCSPPELIVDPGDTYCAPQCQFTMPPMAIKIVIDRIFGTALRETSR